MTVVRPRRLQTGEQHGALDLRAGHFRGEAIGERSPPSIVSGGRPSSDVDSGAHPRERIDDTAHRAGATANASPPMVGSERGGPRGCRPSAAWWCRSWRRRAGLPDGAASRARRVLRSRSCGRPVRRTPDAERLQAGERGRAVGAGRVAADGGHAVGERREHRVAVRNRFVARARASGPRTRRAGRHDRSVGRWQPCDAL